MRKLTFIIFVFLLILTWVLVGCSKDKEKSNYDTAQQSKEVSLSVKEKNITTKTESITLIFTNNSNKEYLYGEEPYLEVANGKAWYKVPLLKTAAWNDIAYRLKSSETRELTLFLSRNFAQLSPGRYRVVKKLNSNAEEIFTISEFEVE